MLVNVGVLPGMSEDVRKRTRCCNKIALVLTALDVISLPVLLVFTPAVAYLAVISRLVSAGVIVLNHIGWYGDFLTLEDVIEGSTWGLDMCEKYHFQMVNNNSKLRGSWDHANDWIANIWLPRALGMNLTKLAHVVSPDVFTTSSAEEMRQNLGGRLEMRFFPDFDSAEAWVLDPNA